MNSDRTNSAQPLARMTTIAAERTQARHPLSHLRSVVPSLRRVAHQYVSVTFVRPPALSGFRPLLTAT